MILLFLFLIEVLVLTFSEVHRWKTLITPLNVLMLTYALATIVAIVYSYSHENVPDFYFPSLIVWIVGLAVFAIPSLLFSSLKKHNVSRFQVCVCRRDDSYKLLMGIASLCILVSLFKLRSLSGNIGAFGTDDFSEEYQTSGVLAHLSVVLCCVFGYAIYKLDKDHLYSIIIIIGALIGLYAIGTKSWIIAPFLIGYFARLLTGKTRLSVKTTIVPLLIIFGVFFLSYFLILIVASTSEMSMAFMAFIVNHFVDYFSGASLAFSLDFQQRLIEPQMGDALIAPLLNVFNFIFDKPYVNPINPVYWDIGELGTNNVRTALGAFLCYSHSTFIFVFMTFWYSFFTNWLYYLSRKSRSIFILLANCTCLTFLTFGFFDFTWVNMTPYEILVIFLLMHIFLYKKRIKKRPLVNNA